MYCSSSVLHVPFLLCALKLAIHFYNILQLDHTSRTPTNPRNYKGKLFKPGRLLRQWLARWYVLETQQNQLLYYDSEDDAQLKGHIDLGEMRSAKVIPAPSSKLISLRGKPGVTMINHKVHYCSLINGFSYIFRHFRLSLRNYAFR